MVFYLNVFRATEVYYLRTNNVFVYLCSLVHFRRGTITTYTSAHSAQQPKQNSKFKMKLFSLAFCPKSRPFVRNESIVFSGATNFSTNWMNARALSKFLMHTNFRPSERFRCVTVAVHRLTLALLRFFSQKQRSRKFQEYNCSGNL